MSKPLAFLSLGALTVVAFWQVRHCEFVNYDDPAYVLGNQHIYRLDPRWAFTTFYNANWHPLTWLSLQFDYQLYGFNAAGYHATNLLLHTANVLLLFWVLMRMTRVIGPSALVAGMFAVHPLHVESVAWISERKDVLSGLFWMLILLAYSWYVNRPGALRYVLVLAAFTLGLMAKPMLVTLPLVLLLLDYWPLKRSGLRWLGVEKMPLILLSVASCIVTVIAQRRGMAVQSLDEVPLLDRTANALHAYAVYLGKAAWPVDLAVFYPQVKLPWMRVAGAAVILAGVSGLALWQRTSRPYLLVGWLWYIGTLVPVIGFLQVGDQAYADRYTYIPLVGVFIMAAYALVEWKTRTQQGALIALLAVLTFALMTWIQVSYWRDSFTLWKRSIAVTGANAEANYGLGLAYKNAGRLADAEREFKTSLEFNLDHEPSNFEMSLIRGQQGRATEALEHWKRAIHYDPDSAWSHVHLASFYIRVHDNKVAKRELEQAKKLCPEIAGHHDFEIVRALAERER